MNDFKDKKVLVFGLGLNQGGVGTVKFFVNQGAIVRATDQKLEKDLKSSIEELDKFEDTLPNQNSGKYKIQYKLGRHREQDIKWADLIIKNPSVRPNNLFIQKAKNLGKEIDTDFGIFLNYVNQKNLITITGTKGKTTTAFLIYQVLKDSGKKVLLAGNIGKSVLDIIPLLDEDTLVIVEISSFQLQNLSGKKFAPHIAVITNIYPDHLNWHKTMEEYIKAKRKLAIYQTVEDYLVISCQETLNSKDFIKGIKSKIIQFCAEDAFPNPSINYNLPLLGEGNADNYTSALAVSEILGIGRSMAMRAFQNFKGVPFRMEVIANVNGIRIINDSASTNPISTEEALYSIDKPILITGGMNKNLEYYKLSATIESYAKMVYFIEGDASKEIIKYMRNTEIVKGKGLYTNLEELLQDVKKEAKLGDTILFSPGATSFNLFQNEFDRGRKFNEAVKRVFEV